MRGGGRADMIFEYLGLSILNLACIQHGNLGLHIPISSFYPIVPVLIFPRTDFVYLTSNLLLFYFTS